MKKIIISIAACTLCHILIQAQDPLTVDTASVLSVHVNRQNNDSINDIGVYIVSESPATDGWSVFAGPTLSFKKKVGEYGDDYLKQKPGVGFQLGIGTAFPFNKHWAVAPAVRFTQKNAGENLGYSDPGSGSMNFIDKYSYNYLGGTILVQYRAGKYLSFAMGPEINYLLAASVKNSGTSGNGKKHNLAKSSKKVGLDLLAGIKFELPEKNSRSKWGLQLMYDHRLSRLNKKKDENGQEMPAYSMKGFQLGLAYNICGCGKK